MYVFMSTCVYIHVCMKYCQHAFIHAWHPRTKSRWLHSDCWQQKAQLLVCRVLDYIHKIGYVCFLQLLFKNSWIELRGGGLRLLHAFVGFRSLSVCLYFNVDNEPEIQKDLVSCFIALQCSATLQVDPGWSQYGQNQIMVNLRSSGNQTCISHETTRLIQNSLKSNCFYLVLFVRINRDLPGWPEHCPLGRGDQTEPTNQPVWQIHVLRLCILLPAVRACSGRITDETLVPEDYHWITIYWNPQNGKLYVCCFSCYINGRISRDTWIKSAFAGV